MSDIKLFRVTKGRIRELADRAPTAEANLQDLIERGLDTFLGVTLLASEYTTGKTHAGRIDTLAIDENHCPVIIEYKRSMNRNVINQGLFYLDWLLDHRTEFSLLVSDRLGRDIADLIEWQSPRLVCLAEDFTRYDQHAVKQINRSIELIRYRMYEKDLVMLELVNAGISVAETTTSVRSGKTVQQYLTEADSGLSSLYDLLRDRLLALGEDVQQRTLKHYIAFRRLKNFACVEVHPRDPKLLVYIKVTPTRRNLKAGFTRDVTQIGHYGTGDLEVTIRSPSDIDPTMRLIEKSYAAN